MRSEGAGGPTERTTGGFNKAALMKHQRAKEVSMKDSTPGKRAHKHIQAWTQFVKTVRMVHKEAPR